MWAVSPYALWRRDTGVYARPKWDNIGYFLKKVGTRAQCEALISVLNRDWIDMCLDGAQVQSVYREIAVDKRNLPMRVLQARVDEDAISKRCFAKDGVWFVDFVVVEDASLLEYKYAIDSKNRVGRVLHTLIEGPPRVGWSDKPNYVLVSGIAGASPAESAAHKKYSECSNLLRAAAYLEKWKTDLSSPDLSKRRMAASALFNLDFGVAGAVRELTKALADDDWEVRYHAAAAMEQVGAAARNCVPELVRLLRDKNPHVRQAAARAVFTLGGADERIEAAKVLRQIGSQAYCSISVLRGGLKDGNASVRAAATAAIDAIERDQAK